MVGTWSIYPWLLSLEMISPFLEGRDTSGRQQWGRATHGASISSVNDIFTNSNQRLKKSKTIISEDVATVWPYVNGTTYPVDQGITTDDLVHWINHDDFVIFVDRILWEKCSAHKCSSKCHCVSEVNYTPHSASTNSTHEGHRSDGQLVLPQLSADYVRTWASWRPGVLAYHSGYPVKCIDGRSERLGYLRRCKMETKRWSSSLQKRWTFETGLLRPPRRTRAR